MRGFQMGSKTKGTWMNIGSWDCKYGGSRGCGCCMPKNIISPTNVRNPSADIREYFYPREIGKSKTPSRR